MKQKAFPINFKGLLLKQIKTKFEISSLVDQKMSGGSKTVLWIKNSRAVTKKKVILRNENKMAC